MENNKKENILKWTIVGILLGIFVLIAIFMITDKIYVYDNYVYSIISKCINPTMTKIVTVITNLADPIFIVIFALVFSYIVGIAKKDKKTALVFCLNLVIVALFNLLLKNIFTRTRPEFINIITESGYSFPSGHSSIAVAFYGYIIYYINKQSKSKNVKIIGTVLLSILIVLIGLSRVYLGVHYASDVTAAFMIYSAYLITYIHVTDKVIFKNNGKSIE